MSDNTLKVITLSCTVINQSNYEIDDKGIEIQNPKASVEIRVMIRSQEVKKNFLIHQNFPI